MREDTQVVVVVEMYQDGEMGVVAAVIEAERYVCPLPVFASYYPKSTLLLPEHGFLHWLVKTKHHY